jgi:hypothetical protein
VTQRSPSRHSKGLKFLVAHDEELGTGGDDGKTEESLFGHVLSIDSTHAGDHIFFHPSHQRGSDVDGFGFVVEPVRCAVLAVLDVGPLLAEVSVGAALVPFGLPEGIVVE